VEVREADSSVGTPCAGFQQVLGMLRVREERQLESEHKNSKRLPHKKHKRWATFRFAATPVELAFVLARCHLFFEYFEI
jgi:hypothetical protein